MLGCVHAVCIALQPCVLLQYACVQLLQYLMQLPDDQATVLLCLVQIAARFTFLHRTVRDLP